MQQPLDTLFKPLYQSQRASQLAMDMEGRSLAPMLATVTTNQDPQNRRRIKVSLPNQPGIESDWCRRLQPFPKYDPPLPVPGQTVMVFFDEGNTLRGWYLSAVNDTNPVLEKSSAQDDHYMSVPGDTDNRTDGNHTVRVGKTLTLQVDSGSTVTLNEDGSVTIQAAGDLSLQDGSGNSLSFRSGGISFGTNSLTVGGKEVASIGAIDTRGDSLTSRGW